MNHNRKILVIGASIARPTICYWLKKYGTNSTAETFPNPYGIDLSSVTFADDTRIVAGENDIDSQPVIYTSSDAISWTAATLNSEPDYEPITIVKSVSYGNGLWLANGYNETMLQ